MPHSVSQITAEIDSRKYHVHFLQMISPKRNTICRRAVDPVGFKMPEWRVLVRERSRGGNSMACGRLLDVGRHDQDLTKFFRYLSQCRNSRTINSIVIGNQYPHELKSPDRRFVPRDWNTQ